MTHFKVQACFGLILVIIGVVLDYVFIEARVADAFKSDPLALLHSWQHRLQGMSVSYMVILGFLNIACALLAQRLEPSRLDWLRLSFIVGGTLLVIGTSFWYASAGPSFRWEPRCTVLTIGLGALMVGTAFELYRVITSPGLKP